MVLSGIRRPLWKLPPTINEDLVASFLVYVWSYECKDK